MAKQNAPHQKACLVILRLAGGETPTQIAGDLGVSRASVYKWWRTFDAQGVKGLCLKTQRGRGDRVDPELAERIVELTEQAIAAGDDPFASDIADMIGVSLPTVYRYWKKARERHTDTPEKDSGEKNIREAAGNPTMADVARRAETSKTTVSKVLNQARGVSPETRKRVEEALEELQYYPHPHLSALMRSRRGKRTHRLQATVAWLYISTDVSRKGPEEEPYGVSHLYCAVCRHAEKLGFKVTPFRLNDPQIPPERLRRILLARGINGLLFANLTPGDYSHAFDEFPSVAFANYQWNAGARVGDELRPALMSVLKNVWERGYRRVGLVHSEYLSERTNYQVSSCVDLIGGRITGEQPIPQISLGDEIDYLINKYLKNKSKSNVHPFSFDHAQWLEQEDWTVYFKKVAKERRWQTASEAQRQEWLQERILDLWCRKFSIDAILTFYGDTRKQLQHCGYRIPEDLGLVHLNWNEDVAGWSGIRHNFELKGQVGMEALAAEMVKDRLFTAKVHPRLLAPPLWVEGDTLPVRQNTDATQTWPKGFLSHLEPLEEYRRDA